MKIEIDDNIDNIYGNRHVKLLGKIQVNKEREKEQMMKTVLQRKGVFKVNISILGV